MKYLIVLLFSFSLTMTIMLMVPNVSLAERVLDPICVNNSQATLCKDNATTQTPDDNSIFGPGGVITKAAGLIALVTGIASVIMIIISAIQYAISGGDPARLNRAKDTIIFALAGLTIALLARFLISFVINKL